MINKLKYGVLTMSILSILYGISDGEVDVVLNKAINICLECIGIG
ncbi:CD1871A family CXXC motif-containing protein [Oceanirhabdus seepicola]|nr:CD1871A family CXXC motif-containing protein [Oceanirhabdus seepicola]